MSVEVGVEKVIIRFHSEEVFNENNPVYFFSYSLIVALLIITLLVVDS